MACSSSRSMRIVSVGLAAILVCLPGGQALAAPGSCLGIGRAAAVRDARLAILELERLGLNFDNMTAVADAAAHLATVARQRPEELRRFARAFVRDATIEDRREALNRLGQLGFKAKDGSDPLAIWGVVAVIAIAVLVGNGCDGDGGCGSTGCTDPDHPCGGSSDDSGGTDDPGSL